jgi:hypothetical protein
MRMSVRIVRAALVISALAIGGAACGGGSEPSEGTASAPAGPRPSSTATVEIVSPTQNQVVHGDTAKLEVKLTGGEIVQQTSTDLQPDQGHLHVFLDDQLVSMTSSTESLLSDLTPGQHLVKVEFVANDHAPFDPRVIAAISFEVAS